MNMFELYCILKLDEVKSLLEITGAVSCLFVTVILGMFLFDYLDAGKKIPLWYKVCSMTLIPMVIFLILAAVLIPSTKQMATIIIAPKIINNEVLKDDLKELYGLAKEELKDLIKKKDVSK